MAQLFKRENSPYWMARFSVPGSDGKARIVRRSTNQKTKKKAQLAAQEFEALERGDGSDDLVQAEIAAILRKVALVASKGALSEAMARDFIGQVYKAANGDELEAWSVSSWFEEWLDRKEKRTSAKTLAKNRTAAKAFLAFIGEEKAARSMDTVTRADIRGFQSSLENGKRVPATINHYLRSIGGAFRAAVIEGVLAISPALGLEPLPEKPGSEREPFEPSELSSIFWACPGEEWRGLFLLGAYAGLRLGDASQIKAGNLDLEDEVLRLTTSKTGARAVIPLHGELIAHFKRNPPPADSKAAVFPELSKAGSGGRSGLSLQFAAILESAGVDRAPIVEGARKDAQRRHRKSFHSLRHSFVSQLANLGVLAERRRLLTSHGVNGDVHSIYTHLQVEELRKDVDRLPSITAA